MTSGLLFYAPVGTTPDNDSWLPLGTTESCDAHVDEDPLTEALLSFDLHGHCVSVSVRTDAISPLGYWVLFQRRHPRIKAMHAAYRRKARNR
jgi:hypothetical protein